VFSKAIRQNGKHHMPFYLIEEQLSQHAVRTVVKQGYAGKIIEYWVPATHINPSNIWCNMSEVSIVNDDKYDPTQIYQMIKNDTTPVLHKLRSISQEPRKFDDDTKQLAYGVINPETKHSTLFPRKHIVYGSNDVITFDFGEFMTISHIETFGRYPKHVSYKEFSKSTLAKCFNNFRVNSVNDLLRVCVSEDPQQYVKKFDVKYRDKTGKWISLGIHTGNQDISCGKLNRVDVYTRYLRIIPIDFRGVDPSMEIIIYGPTSHLPEPQCAKTLLVKYIVKEKCTRYIPDGCIGCIYSYRCKYCHTHRFVEKHNTKDYLRFEND